MINLVIFSSTIIYKSTYVIVRLEVLVGKTKFAAYVEFYVRSEFYTTITTRILGILEKELQIWKQNTYMFNNIVSIENYLIKIYYYFVTKRYKVFCLDLKQLW